MRAHIGYITVLGIALFSFVGCGVHHGYDRGVIRAERYTQDSPYLVFNTQVVNSAQADQVRPSADDTVAWWQVRNEQSASVAAGYATYDVTELRIRVRDTQRSNDGRPNNSYRRSTRSLRTGEITR